MKLRQYRTFRYSVARLQCRLLEGSLLVGDAVPSEYDLLEIMSVTIRDDRTGYFFLLADASKIDAVLVDQELKTRDGTTLIVTEIGYVSRVEEPSNQTASSVGESCYS